MVCQDGATLNALCRAIEQASFFRKKEKKVDVVDPFEELLASLPKALRPIVILSHQYGTEECSTIEARSSLLSSLLSVLTLDESLQYVRPRFCGRRD